MPEKVISEINSIFFLKISKLFITKNKIENSFNSLSSNLFLLLYISFVCWSGLVNFLKFKKITNPLQETKDLYKRRNKFEEKELKEFSILFLVINNLSIFRKNIELVSEINFSNNLMNEFREKLINYLLSEKFFDRKKLEIDDFDQKFKNIISLININAPVKIICKNKSDTEIISMFNEIIKEIKKIELQKKIEFLENKVSLNLDEKLYSELLSLRNQLKGG